MLMIISPYFPLFAIAVFAFMIPILSDRIGVPAVVGEIICGVIIGRSVLGLFTGEEEGIAFLSSFGFIFLMFLVGLEIDFSQVEVHGAKLFVFGSFTFLHARHFDIPDASTGLRVLHGTRSFNLLSRIDRANAKGTGSVKERIRTDNHHIGICCGFYHHVAPYGTYSLLRRRNDLGDGVNCTRIRSVFRGVLRG